MTGMPLGPLRPSPRIGDSPPATGSGGGVRCSVRPRGRGAGRAPMLGADAMRGCLYHPYHQNSSTGPRLPRHRCRGPTPPSARGTRPVPDRSARGRRTSPPRPAHRPTRPPQQPTTHRRPDRPRRGDGGSICNGVVMTPTLGAPACELDQPQATSASARSIDAATPTTGRRRVVAVARILVVEDDETIGDALHTSLHAHDHAVRWERTGRGALAVSTVPVPDLVLLDLGLPDLDGVE